MEAGRCVVGRGGAIHVGGIRQSAFHSQTIGFHDFRGVVVWYVFNHRRSENDIYEVLDQQLESTTATLELLGMTTNPRLSMQVAIFVTSQTEVVTLVDNDVDATWPNISVKVQFF